ncbi:serine-rich adhesin for platelets-like isoform X1 [Bombus flavifrons]|uniref:serine-rich adhesin for platelets-like isoform X1 n=2 Tax=Bombus flavifrons TaxID=103934 RepID=UPI00370398DD
MQWRRQRKVIHVIGSSKHVLLLARYQDAPPGEEDEEEGLRNGYGKRQENDTHSLNSRFGQSGYKPLRAGSSSNGGAYAGAASRHNSSGSTSQPKIIFNEDEYTRITTPRQDMLFKKGYLSKKKPWAGNANTSATSSTTESQSASHSTAGRDGSETAEDQQLLDRDCGTGEYAPVMDSNPQLGYGTFYDHVGGYYYEYPVMLVGPAPMAAQAAPSVLAAMPCAPVPLRPIEWVNSTIVPKLPGEPYCIMNYENNQCVEESTVVVEEQEDATLPMESTSRMWNENGTRSIGYGDSVGGEMDDEQSIIFIDAKEGQQVDEQEEERLEEQYEDEQQAEEQPLENGMNGGAYFDPMMMQDPVHVPHVIPTVPQPYMYPGHYMFGPPLVNVNGITIQSGLMIRTTDFATMSAAMSAACAKRKKKKKRRRQRRFTTGNTEDEEEGEYSSECDTGLPSSELPWTVCSSTVTTTTTTTTSNRPLNPECQEFQLRRTPLPIVLPSANNTPTSETSTTINQPSALSSDANLLVDNESNAVCNGVISDDSKNQSDELSDNGKSDQQPEPTTSTSLENSRSKSLDTFTSSDNESNRLTNCLPGDEEAALSTDEVVNEATDVDKLPSITEAANNDCPSANELCERPSNETNGETLTNGNLDSDTSSKNASMTTSRPLSPVFNDENSRSGSITPKSVENAAFRDDRNHESLSSNKSSLSTGLSKRKYSAKGSKFAREPTPGPDLNSTTEPENETKIHDLTENLQKMDLSNDTKLDSKFESDDKKAMKVDQVSGKFGTKTAVCSLLNKETIEATNEDSGFESQTQLSDYPITQAVTEWLRKEKSPDLFIASAISMDCEEDEDDMDQEPPKNLQSNPILALSASSGADNTALSRTAICGEFAGLGNIKSGQEQQQPDASNNNSGASRKKKDAKRRSEERRRVARHVVIGKVDHEMVSSSDSCGQQEDSANITRRKNLAKQQRQDVVDDICEFTEKDSVAGVRVASSSRIDSKRVNARRTKRQGKSHARNPSNNIDTKIRHTEDVDDEDDDGIVEDTMNVRTFEKGEIIVSEDGKLLTSSTYEPSLRKCHDAATTIKAPDKSETGKQTTERKIEEERKRSSSSIEDEKSGSGIDSLDSIEEPDVLECWETEIIEPLVTPKRMLQSEGIVCEGEAAEDDTIEVEQVNVDYVQKYYRLARESATSVEEISLKADPPTSSKSVPNMSERKEEIPAQKEPVKDKGDMPIDEAFEVYESCYTGNSPFLAMDSKVFKLRTLYGQEGETPIPCKTVCCQIQ